MSPKALSIDVETVVTGIRIDVASGSPRLILEGVQRSVADGSTVRAFVEDVTDQLNPGDKGRVTGLVTRAQAWIDAK